MLHKRGFRQGEADGLCGVYSSVNAIKYLYPAKIKERDTAAKLVSYIALRVNEHFANLFAMGQDRKDMRLILRYAKRWSERNHCPITIVENHPARRESVEAYLDRLRESLEASESKTVAILGFGDWVGPRPNPMEYEPHWTVAWRVRSRIVDLIDSDVFKQISRGDIGIKPNEGWQLEDCFLVSKI
jgi:hypothetical protein